MAIEKFEIEIKGKKTILDIDTDPVWGDMQRLLKESHTTTADGQQKVDMMGFLDRLLEIVIVRSDNPEFDIKNRTVVKQLPTSVMTKLIGGVTEKLPLQEYLDNMGSLANMSNQQ